jgi:hypothetical protein
MNTRLVTHHRSTRRKDLIGMVVTAGLWVAAMAVVTPLLRIPAHVDQVIIDNPSAWAVDVHATDENAEGWVAIGVVEREDEQTFRGVLDQGDIWIFRFAYGGQFAETQLTRTELEQDNWRVTVPDQLVTRLRAAGVPESPH